jgi:GT2 family glycosyltransferase
LFHSLGGFDEQNFAVQFNDIDLCLRAREAGRRVVYEPSAVLYHVTSATRGREYDYNETLRFLKKYAGYRDPFISPHLDPVSICGPTPMLAGTR